MSKTKYKIPSTIRYVFETTPERSKQMSKIRSKNTQPEIILRKALWQQGVRYRLNVSKLPGKPDIVIAKYKLVIFVDGEFWHGYDWENKKDKIKANKDYWIPKIEKNIKRDLVVKEELEACGYVVLRFWASEIKKYLPNCLSIIKQYIDTAK